MNCKICSCRDIEFVYYDKNGEIVGCERCIEERHADDVEDEMLERAEDGYYDYDRRCDD